MESLVLLQNGSLVIFAKKTLNFKNWYELQFDKMNKLNSEIVSNYNNYNIFCKLISEKYNKPLFKRLEEIFIEIIRYNILTE